MTTSIQSTGGAASAGWWPSPGGVGSAPGSGRAGATDQLQADAACAAAEALARASSGARQSPALGSALDKMQSFAAIALATGVDAAISHLMVEQSKQNRDQIKQAASDIKQHFAKLKQQNQQRIKQIKARAAARRKAAKWGFLGKLFKAIGAALCAASSIFTGGAGAVAAGLLIASLIVQCTVKGDAGKWIGLGLSIAAAVVSLGSSFLGSGAQVAGTAAENASNLSSLAAGAQKATELGGLGATVAGHGCGVGKGYADKQAMDAQAAMQELTAILEKLRGENDDKKDEIEMLIEADSRCLDQLMKMLDTSNQTTVTAASV